MNSRGGLASAALLACGRPQRGTAAPRRRRAPPPARRPRRRRPVCRPAAHQGAHCQRRLLPRLQRGSQGADGHRLEGAAGGLDGGGPGRPRHGRQASRSTTTPTGSPASTSSSTTNASPTSSDPAYIRKITAAHKGGVPAMVIHCSMHSYRAAEVDDWREFLGVTAAGTRRRTTLR